MPFFENTPRSSSARSEDFSEERDRSKADVFSFFVANLKIACDGGDVDTIPKLASVVKNVFKKTIGYSLDSENLRTIKKTHKILKLSLEKMENTARSHVNRNDNNRHLDYYPLPPPKTCIEMQNPKLFDAFDKLRGSVSREMQNLKYKIFI